MYTLDEKRMLATALETDPIKIESNNLMIDFTCSICGLDGGTPDVPYWAFFRKLPVCERCINEHTPNLLSEINELNKDAWEDFNKG
jgi:hypothetical protein